MSGRGGEVGLEILLRLAELSGEQTFGVDPGVQAPLSMFQLELVQ